MTEFLSTFVFLLPGIMAYFWLQVFGVNPSVKHTPPEFTGIAALLWLPVSFVTLLVLNIWGIVINNKYFSVDIVWSLKALNDATSDIRYLVLFLLVSFFVSFFICWLWTLWGYELIRVMINKVRETRKIAPLSSSSSVWEEFFIKINKEDKGLEDSSIAKEAVYIVYKIDKPDEFVIGSMTKVSRPLEVDKALVLEDTSQWMESAKTDFEYDTVRVYIDTKSGMVVKEIDFKNPKNKPIPDLED